MGHTSFFPHMEDEWQEMVDHRTMKLPDAGNENVDKSLLLCSIRDEEAFFVDGSKQSTTVLSRMPSHM
jgi:hypothetical protein